MKADAYAVRLRTRLALPPVHCGPSIHGTTCMTTTWPWWRPALLGVGLVFGQAAFTHAHAQAAAPLPAVAEAAINQWTERFITSRRADYERALQRAQPWAEMIATKLAAARLPGALVYLPLVESLYSPWAESSAHAVGLWQLMPGTARGLGLEISNEIDERRDPWKATDAAIRHLQSLYRESRGDWLMTLAAYNAGTGRVRERSLRVPSSLVPGRAAYWTVTPFLPRETQHYVPQLLAAYRVGSDPDRYGITLPRHASYPALARVSVPPHTSLALIAQLWEMSEDEVWAWNPALMRRESPSRWYAVVLPADHAEERQRRLVAIRRYEAADAQPSRVHSQTPAPTP